MCENKDKQLEALVRVNVKLVEALHKLMSYNPREYWDGVGNSLRRKAAGSNLLETLDLCEQAIQESESLQIIQENKNDL